MADPDPLQRIMDILGDNLTKLGVPIISGLPFGHGERPFSVSVGSIAGFDAKTGLLTISH